MNSDTSPAPVELPAEAQSAKPEKKEDPFHIFLIKLVLIVLVLRSFIFAPFSIPSESMLPRLLIGDYVIASKWSYGFSKYSLPFSAPLIPGKIFGRLPERGDVVIFKAPPQNDKDFIKRVIGLPGDQIQMKGGVLWLNGKEVPKVKQADYVIPVTQNMIAAANAEHRLPCVAEQFTEKARAGGDECRYPQFRETLPNGVSYNVLDMGDGRQMDDTEVFVVPADHVFMMGDNRDNSEDSRFSTDIGGIGYVPLENLEAKAQFMWFSTDGTANWFLPWTWFSAARFSRIGAAV